MKRKKQHSHFPNLKALVQFIEEGNPVIHKKSREIFGSLRELPALVEAELHLLVPYNEKEAARDLLKAQKERERELRRNGLDMDELFDPDL